jgi:hypothetical protein
MAMVTEHYVALNQRTKGCPVPDTVQYPQVTVTLFWYPPLISATDNRQWSRNVGKIFPAATEVLGLKCSDRWPMNCGGTGVGVRLLVGWMCIVGLSYLTSRPQGWDKSYRKPSPWWLAVVALTVKTDPEKSVLDNNYLSPCVAVNKATEVALVYN